MADGLVRLPTVATRFLLEVAAAPWFGAIGIVLVVAMVRGREKWGKPRARGVAVGDQRVDAGRLLRSVPGVPDYENNLDWAAGRLVMQIIPLATWPLVVTLTITGGHGSERRISGPFGPGTAPEWGASRKMSSPPGPAASTMPSLVPNRIFRGPGWHSTRPAVDQVLGLVDTLVSGKDRLGDVAAEVQDQLQQLVGPSTWEAWATRATRMSTFMKSSNVQLSVVSGSCS
ncbi:MAG: hypothetical protein CM1200mP2_10510 [Planctomycetaceae bacterium]|nr:MAG: hypothetical protein CM1200mP2_10510 [Planctomycetaceae bacterium]